MMNYFVVNHSNLILNMCLENLSHITVDFVSEPDQTEYILINYLAMTIPRKTLALLGIYIFILKTQKLI